MRRGAPVLARRAAAVFTGGILTPIVVAAHLAAGATVTPTRNLVAAVAAQPSIAVATELTGIAHH